LLAEDLEQYLNLEQLCEIKIDHNKILYFHKSKSLNSDELGESQQTTYRVKNNIQTRQNFVGWLDVNQYKNDFGLSRSKIIENANPVSNWTSKNKFTPVSEMLTNVFLDHPPTIYSIGTVTNGDFFIYNIQVTIFPTLNCKIKFDIMSTHERSDILNFFKKLRIELKENNSDTSFALNNSTTKINSTKVSLVIFFIILAIASVFSYLYFHWKSRKKK